MEKIYSKIELENQAIKNVGNSDVKEIGPVQGITSLNCEKIKNIKIPKTEDIKKRIHTLNFQISDFDMDVYEIICSFWEAGFNRFTLSAVEKKLNKSENVRQKVKDSISKLEESRLFIEYNNFGNRNDYIAMSEYRSLLSLSVIMLKNNGMEEYGYSIFNKPAILDIRN